MITKCTSPIRIPFMKTSDILSLFSSTKCTSLIRVTYIRHSFPFLLNTMEHISPFKYVLQTIITKYSSILFLCFSKSWMIFLTFVSKIVYLLYTICMYINALLFSKTWARPMNKFIKIYYPHPWALFFFGLNIMIIQMNLKI